MSEADSLPSSTDLSREQLYEHADGLLENAKLLCDSRARQLRNAAHALKAAADALHDPGKIDAPNPEARGRHVGSELFWKIGDEDISDSDLRRWCRENLSDCWQSGDTGIVAFHTRAYANRRRALSEFMRRLKWA